MLQLDDTITLYLQHTFLRTYASLHLALMSAAIVSSLPGISDHLHKSLPQDWLQSLGLWNPSVSHSIAPVLVLLLVVSSSLLANVVMSNLHACM